MFSAARLRLTACGVLWCVLGFNAIFVMAALPAPTLHFTQPVNGTNIELSSKVVMECFPPKEAQYPIFLNLGKQEQPLVPLLFYRLTSYNSVLFTIPAVEEYEGLFVCWYNVSKTNEVSAPSKATNLNITSLPVPSISVKPTFIQTGKNYSVSCVTSTYFYNATFRIYFRDAAGSAHDGALQLFGILNLNGTGVITYRDVAEENETREYICDVEVFYRNRILRSPFSRSLTVTAEMLPARLLSDIQGIRCMGKLEVFEEQKWYPVCMPYGLKEATAQVACRELGCGKVVQLDTSTNSLQSRSFQCSGNEGRLRDCSFPSERRFCNRDYNLWVMCSVFAEDFLPAPKLSIKGFNFLTSVHVYEGNSLEVYCTFNAPWLGNKTVSIALKELNQGVKSSFFLTTAGKTVVFTMSSPVSPGDYACIARFDDSFQTIYSPSSNSVTITTGKPPNVGLIVGALIVSLIGAGILVCLCVFRVSDGETQTDTNALEKNVEKPASDLEGEEMQ